MQPKTIILILGLALVTTSVGFAYHQNHIQNLESEKAELELYYSYSMDMLDGFMKAKNSMKEQVKSIRSNPQDSI